MLRPLLLVLLLLALWIALEILLRRVRSSVHEASRSNPLAALLLAALGGRGVAGSPPRKSAGAAPPPTREPTAGSVAHLVRCRRCGIHVAERLSVGGAGGPFCSTTCRDAPPSP